MCNNENHGKIKNDKVLRWWMELREFAFDIAYRSGKLNAAPDALSRVYCAAMRENMLYNIHVSLCHPGITCLIHYVRASTYTSIYDPRGNGQCERYNGIIWTSVKLAVKSRKLHILQWELVLPDVLHSIRSLLCTTTNETPHER